MRTYDDDQSYPPNTWEEDNGYAGDYNEEEAGGYGEYEAYDDYADSDIDEELSHEHNFRIAMNVFDLISMLVGLAVILVLSALLFTLFNWVQRDLSQSLAVFTTPFMK